jgi:hypothetical protein
MSQHHLTICLHKGAQRHFFGAVHVHHIPSPGVTTAKGKGFEGPIQGRCKHETLGERRCKRRAFHGANL